MDLIVGGKNGTLTGTVSPSNATNKNVNWSNLDSSVATVVYGVVHAVGIGQATITVITEEGGFSDSAIITVCQSGYDSTDYEK